MKAIHANPGLLDNAFVFEKICYALNHTKPNVEYFEPASILQIAKAISKLPLHTWNNEIKQYVAHIARQEGWVTLPKILLFAQHDLEMLSSSVELDEDQKKVQQLKHLAVEKYLNS